MAGNGVAGVVLTRHLVVMLAEWWQCSCTTEEYDVDDAWGVE